MHDILRGQETIVDKIQIVNTIVERLNCEAANESCELTKNEILQEKELFEQLEFGNEKESTTQIGSLIRLKCNNMSANYFLSPSGTGNLIKVGNTIVVQLSVFSPLGANALGLQVGDEFSVDSNGIKKTYTIEDIF